MPENSKWSDDEFLNQVRACSDPVADQVVAELHARHGGARRPHHETYRTLFEHLQDNSEAGLQDAPPELRQFFEGSRALPEWADAERLDHGQRVFTRHAVPAALVLLAKSLPAGYSAPNLGIILSMSGDLGSHPYTRLLGVLQVVVSTGSEHGFETESDGDGHTNGAAVVSAQKLRLLHSAIRVIARRKLPTYEKKYGIPVNHEDMLATIMGFSLLVLEGLETLDIELTEQEREDYYHVWQVFAVMCGIYPPGRPGSSDFVPTTVAEAREFYAAYERRWYEHDVSKNPQGAALAKANLGMMKLFVPRWCRFLGLGIVPRLYIQELNGAEGCRRVGIKPIPGFSILRWILLRLPRITMRLIGRFEGNNGQWALRFMQKLIVGSYGGKVEFLLPDNLADMRKLAPPSAMDDPAVRRRTAQRSSGATGTQ